MFENTSVLSDASLFDSFISLVLIAVKVAAAFFCLAASQAGIKNIQFDSRVGGARMAWLFFAVALIICGLFGLLNGDAVISSYLRASSHEDGWYDIRRYFQFFFLFVVAVLALKMYRYLKELISREQDSTNGFLALRGMCIEVIVTLLDTVSWHYSDDILNLSLMGISVSNALSILAMGMVITAAIRDTVRMTKV